MRTVAILIFSLFITLNANSALALTCKSGTADCTQSNNNASDCTALGYTNANAANCTHYLYCPFNTAYKSCVAFTDDVDPTPPVADCSDYPLTACPENGICQNCPDDATYKKLTGCESGYRLNTAKTACVCGTLCLDRYVDLPDNAEYEYKECDACGEKSNIISGWKCKTGYQKTSDGSACEASTCPTGYAKSVEGCGDTGSDGWTLGTKDSNGCGKCTKNECSGNAEYTSVDKCGSSGANGWNYSSCYYGDELRGTCDKKDCPADSYTNPNCGAGYTKFLTGAPQNTYYSGDDKCYSCTAVPCPDGYSTDIASAANCKTGETYSSSGYSAGKTCGKCTFTCPDGYSEDIKSINDCGNGLVGDKGWNFSSSNGCGKCTEKACSGNTKYTSVDKCGSSGANGWNYSSCYYGDELRGTCTAKTCSDHRLANYSSTSTFGILCKTISVYMGDSKGNCSDCIDCEDAGKSNPEGIPYSRYNNCTHVCSYTNTGDEPIFYTSYEANVIDSNGRSGKCYGFTATPGEEGDCCCMYSDAVALGDCM